MNESVFQISEMCFLKLVNYWFFLNTWTLLFRIFKLVIWNNLNLGYYETLSGEWNMFNEANAFGNNWNRFLKLLKSKFSNDWNIFSCKTSKIDLLMIERSFYNEWNYIHKWMKRVKLVFEWNCIFKWVKL